jgi:hypothetical protein
MLVPLELQLRQQKNFDAPQLREQFGTVSVMHKSLDGAVDSQE